jgi:prepilin-type N-terminal cleavage/methylation domain-containing protein
MDNKRYGFTIVELLIVIVIIGILAAITIVSYIGISKKATEAGLVSDLDGAKRQLELYKTEYGIYPTSVDNDKCPTAPTADLKYCLKNKSFVYSPSGDGLSYILKLDSGSLAYKVTNDSVPQIANAACPTGFISVPGSATYATNDFCVMKYEAKWSSGGIPTSVPSGSPWTIINQTDAATSSSKVAGCSGCHLITEAKWMTIAQNVLSVADNWTGGSVGSGYIYFGQTDNVPSHAVDSGDGSDSYYNTNDDASDLGLVGNLEGRSQKRTLTLTNGESIWDFSGNVWEWTSGQITGNQPGATGETDYWWKEWPDVNANYNLAVNPTPAGTGLPSANTWNVWTGVGALNSYIGDPALRGFIRGGSWGHALNAGVLSLYLHYSPSEANNGIGFRVAR